MPTIDDAADILAGYNLTGAVQTAVPDLTVTQDEDQFWQIGYTIFTSPTDVSGSGYYISSSPEYLNFATGTHYLTAVEDAAANIMSGDLTNEWSVLPTDVAKISFYTLESETGIITIGQVRNTISWFDSGQTDPDGDPGNPAGTGITYPYNPDTSSWAHDPNLYGDIWLNVDHQSSTFTGPPPENVWTSYSSIVPGTGAYIDILHEIGHALGLADAKDTAIDSQKYTIMSYVPVDGMLGSSFATSVSPSGLQLFDIAALQEIYGINWTTRNDNSLYCANTAFASPIANGAFIYTIWDGGGTNVIDTHGFAGAARVDLRQGEFSSIGVDASGNAGYVPGVRDFDNVAIAFHTLVQNGIVTQDNSILVGNQSSNVLVATGSYDTIYADGVVYDGRTGFIAPITGDTNDPNNSIPTLQNDILAGGLGATTFYGSLGSDVIVAYYDKATIDTATSGWSTYWDAAGQFTGTNNETGAALPDLDPGMTRYTKLVDYSGLDNAENVSLAGGNVHIDVTAYAGYLSVAKNTDSSCIGTDVVYGATSIAGTNGNDSFTGANNDLFGFWGTKGNDTYDYGSYVSTIDYSRFDGLGTNAHIAVTASGSGLTIDKTDDTGSLGEDTAITTVGSVAGTAGNDSFSGYIVGGIVYYNGHAGNDSYSFDMAGLIGGSVHTAPVEISEDAGGSLSNISVANSDGVLLVSYYTTTGGAVSEFIYSDSANPADGLTITFGQSGVSALSTFVAGGTTFEFGTLNADSFSAASGIHVYAGGAGSNTVDYSAATGAVTANLSTNSASNNGWGYADKFLDIANMIGSNHDDNLTGDSNANTLNGGAGNDTISSGAGDDRVIGGGGNNTLDGGTGSDTVDYSTSTASFVEVDLAHGTGYADSNTDTLSNIENAVGSSNFDYLVSSSGNNILNGGAGGAEVMYNYAASGVTVDLVNGTATGDGNDTLINITGVNGSAHNDTLIGNSSTALIGGNGNDTLEYGDADYIADPAGITVNLSTGVATDGWGCTDTLIGVHYINTTSYADTITCSSSGDTVFSLGGNDLVYTGSGNDTLDGGAGGTDTVSYANASAGVTVTLVTAGGQNTGGSGTDHIYNFENLTGSAFDDTLTGDLNANVVNGGAGNDILAGKGGADTIDGGAGTNTIDYSAAAAGATVNLGTGTASNDGDGSSDTFTNIANITGSAFNDTLTGDANANVITGGAGNDTVQGGGGNDTLTGGSGTDTVSYDSAAAAVTVSLAITSAQATGGAGSDTISGFENLTGSAYDDILTGDSNANTINGGAGNDIIAARGGSDTIDGGSGTDTIDYSAAAAGATANLGTGTASNDGDGSSDTLTNIENITGSAFADNLTGDGNANLIEGGAGNDTLAGGAGTDMLTYAHASSAVTVSLTAGTATGGAGSDTISGFENLTGSGFNDSLTGDGNANLIEGGAGNDTMNGVGGTDTLTYANATGGITISLAIGTGQATGGAGTDTISNFENLTGSAFNDTLTGSTGVNTIDGGAGDDIIEGLAGNDTLIGGSGIDTVSYQSAGSLGVTVDLSTSTASGAGTDTLSGFENILGSIGADTLTGDANDNVIEGGAGNDTMTGGAGIDTASYEHAGAAVTVNLGNNLSQNTIGAGSDKLSGFENLTGSAFADTLTGTSGDNIIDGGAGNDTLNGSTGVDTATYIHATSAVTVSLAAGTATGGGGSDTLTNFENITGSAFNDNLTGSTGNNVIEGLGGNDSMNGNSGTDTVTYEHATAAVTVSLATTGAQNTLGAGTDTISNFENLTGSSFDDTLTGSSALNTITGGAGNDTITGGGDADNLYGGTGSDTFLFLAATALGASVSIQDFTNGAGNDKIDIRDVISGYDPATMAITDWVQITTSGANSLLSVDTDGTGSGHTWQQIATIVGVTGLTDEAALVASGNLVVHA